MKYVKEKEYKKEIIAFYLLSFFYESWKCVKNY